MRSTNPRSRATPAAVIALLLACATAHAQDADRDVYMGGKVANFSLAGHGYGSPAFESLSFWNNPAAGKLIDYEYGAAPTKVRLRSLGKRADGKGFSVQFPNGLVLDVVPAGKTLQVSDRAGRYRKTFAWLYEGPVDGRGTFCTPCVEEQDAVGFVEAHFAR